MVAVALIGGLGIWWVRKADRSYALAQKSGYVEFHRLRKQADLYGVLYGLAAVACLAFYPLGLIGAFWVVGLATYLRFR